MKKFNNKGFTLIEIITAAGIMVTISGFIMGILYTSIKGGTKSGAINEVSQNGNQAMSLMSNIIASSTQVTALGAVSPVDCSASTPPPPGTTISLLQSDGSTITFACYGSNPLPDTLTQYDGVTTKNLINDDKVKVEPLTCTFSCRQPTDNTYASPIIDIVFTLTQRSGSPSVDDTARSSFNSSVSLRNYNPF